MQPSIASLVALRKESVDRNYFGLFFRRHAAKSLSARRAWIEIDIDDKFGGLMSVALRKESVDRNTNIMESSCAANWSLSARRAWIEMLESKQIDPSVMQSLSARRAWIEISSD